MRVLHIVNRRKISKKDHKYINEIIKHQKKSGIKPRKYTLLSATRYIISRLLWSKYAFVHLHEPGPLVRFAFYMLSKVDKTPIAISFYSSINPSSLFKGKANKLFYEGLIRKSKAIFFNDSYLHQEAKKLYKRISSKLFLVEYGVNASEVLPNQPSQLKFSHIFLVKNDHSQGFDDTLMILEAFSYLPKNYKIVLSDEFGDSREQIIHCAENMGLRNFIEFAKGNELSHDIFIDLTRKTLSTDALDSLASGISVIGFRNDINIQGYYSIFETPPKKISQVIKLAQQSTISVDSSALKRLYSWDARANQYKAVYDFMR